MAFNTAITGIKASQIELDVTGSNIANASTVGYKSSRTEFADIYTTVAVGAGSTNTTGSGVTVSDIAQDFTAGTIEFTNNNLDLAIDGSGFFQLDDGQGGITYTRSGGFELDKEGNVVTKSGKYLQGYGLDASGNQLPIGNLTVSEKENPPKPTDNVDLSFNIDSRADATDLLRPYDPDDSGTFTYSTTVPIYDSLGNENTVKFDLVEQPPVREQQTVTFNNATNAGELEFAGVAVDLDPATNPLIAGATATAEEVAATVASLEAAIRTRDPRIASVEVDPSNEAAVLVTYFASATDAEQVVINDAGAYTALGTATTPASVESNPDFSAIEQQAIRISTPTGAGTIEIGGVSVAVSNATTPPDTATDVINRIVANQSDIIAANPQIESITADTVNGRVLINYYADEGDVNPLTVTETLIGGSTQTTAEVQTATIAGTVGVGAAGNIDFSGVTVALADGDDPAAIAGKIKAALDAEILAGTAPAEFLGATVSVSGADVTINYAAGVGDVADNYLTITDTDSTGASISGISIDTQYSQVVTPGSTLAVGEIQSFDVSGPATAGDITVGGVTVTLGNGDTALQIADKIAAALNAAGSPPTGFSSATAVGSKVIIEYAGSAHNVDDISFVDTDGTGAAAGTIQIDKSYNQAETLVDGDVSHLGVYQMFAYLNGTELLDIGKEVAPGAPGSGGSPVATEVGAVILTFDITNGVLSTVNGLAVGGAGTAPPLTITGADPADPANLIDLDITGTTQFASDSIVKTVTQDGYAKGDLIGVSFAEDGTMVASYSNGQNTNLGIVALATFENQSGLQSVGDTEWGATLDSGQAILNPPGTGLNGLLSSGALEQSNVDLSEELVALIEAQRNFQANSKTLQTENAVTQTILQIS